MPLVESMNEAVEIMGVVVLEVETNFEDAYVLEVPLDAANMYSIVGRVEGRCFEVRDIGYVHERANVS
jgi:hypothetical protein